MKSFIPVIVTITLGRSPHRERGLKYHYDLAIPAPAQSLPTQGAWIEMISLCATKLTTARRSPHRERGLKLNYYQILPVKFWSLPTQGAWIEI